MISNEPKIPATDTTVVSKFRDAYFYRLIFTHAFCFVILLACILGYCFALKAQTRNTCVLIALFDLTLWVGAITELASVSKVFVVQGRIENIAIVTRKKTILPIAEIKSIEKERIVSHINGVAISDGYFQYTINFKHLEDFLLVSPDCYSNCDALIHAIRSQLPETSQTRQQDYGNELPRPVP